MRNDLWNASDCPSHERCQGHLQASIILFTKMEILVFIFKTYYLITGPEFVRVKFINKNL